MIETLLDLLWSLWSELGVPGWEHRHAAWHIDPEPLIVMTAVFADHEPRLRDESLRWCIDHARYLSAARLKNAVPLFDRHRALVTETFGPYAAAVNANAGTRWSHPPVAPPLAVLPQARNQRGSRSERLEPFRRPSQLSIRLRALFGVGARAEIVRAIIALHQGPGGAPLFTAGDFPDCLYTRRNVADELESLRLSGLLHTVSRGARRAYTMPSLDPLVTLASPLPTHYPRWTSLLPLLLDLHVYAASSDSAAPLVRAVQANRLASRASEALLTAQLSSYPAVPSTIAAPGGEADVVQAFSHWTQEFIRYLASPDSNHRPAG